MKYKSLVAAIFLSLTMAMAAHSDTRSGPRGSDGAALQNWDYGGVDYSTVSFSSGSVIAFTGKGEIVGIIVSSGGGNLGDFVMFRDTPTIQSPLNSGGTEQLTTDEVFRLYISSVNTTVGTGGGQSFKYGTVQALPAPIRFINGCVWKASANVYNMITVLYHKFTESPNK